MNAEFEKGLRDMTASSSVLTREIGSYILDGGGKRMRPKLVLLMGEALGLSQTQTLPLAYAVELLHNASLLHDDVVDGTEIRRARPTANQVFGDKPALLAGDYLSASALDIVFSLENVRLAAQIVKTIKKMAEGELLEIDHAAAFHDRVDDYLQIIYLKTAALFELCTMAPGILAGLPAEEVDILAQFGRSIGMAFQIVDDIINVAPVEQDDKDAYNDIAERKSTLPLIYIFRENPSLMAHLNRNSLPEDWCREIIPHVSPAILKQSRDLAQTFLAQAVKSLEGTGFFSPGLESIPSQVLAPLENRF